MIIGIPLPLTRAVLLARTSQEGGHVKVPERILLLRTAAAAHDGIERAVSLRSFKLGLCLGVHCCCVSEN